MIPNLKNTYPSWGDLMAVLGVYIATLVLFNLVGSLLIRFEVIAAEPTSALVYVLTFSTTILYALLLKRLRGEGQPRLLHFGFRKADPALLLWGVVAVFATSLTIEPILNLFPSKWLDWMAEQMKQGEWMMFTTIIAAPVLEEILFRGVIQESITRKYGPWRGILIGSAIFGIIHGIPQQVVNAFFVGGVLGYIYYRTGSLIPVIIIHAINNAIAYFTWMIGGEKITLTREAIGNDSLYYIIYGVACVVFLLSVGMMVRTLRRESHASRSQIPPEKNGDPDPVFEKKDII